MLEGVVAKTLEGTGVDKGFMNKTLIVRELSQMSHVPNSIEISTYVWPGVRDS